MTIFLKISKKCTNFEISSFGVFDEVWVLTTSLPSRVGEPESESEVFGWIRIPKNTGSRSRIFCPSPTPDVHLDHFLHHTPKLGIPVQMVNFIGNFCWNRNFLLCTTISIPRFPRFPLILTAKFHFLYVKESEWEILERSESGVGVGNFGK